MEPLFKIVVHAANIPFYNYAFAATAYRAVVELYHIGSRNKVKNFWAFDSSQADLAKKTSIYFYKYACCCYTMWRRHSSMTYMNWSGMMLFSCSSAVHLRFHSATAVYRCGVISATWLCCGCSGTHHRRTTIQPTTGTTLWEFFPQQEWWLVSIHFFIGL